jgi:hypothetical protein
MGDPVNRFAVAVATACALALAGPMVPAMATESSAAGSTPVGISADERKKPKPPKPTVAIPKEARAIERWIKAQPKDWQKAKSYFVQTIDPDLAGTQWEKLAKRAARPAFQIHALLGQPVTSSHRVYVGWGKPWLESAVPADACPWISDFSTGFACYGSDVIYTRFQGFAAYSPGMTPKDPIPSMVRFGSTGLIGHELVHHVQSSLYPQKALRQYPEASTWLTEGWAVMIQTLIAMRVEGLSYTLAREYSLRTMDDANCIGYKLKDLLAPAWFTSCVYVKGYLAMEYLMARTGDMEAGWTWISQDAATSEEAFTKAFDMDFDTFMAKADAYADREMALRPLRLIPQ